MLTILSFDAAFIDTTAKRTPKCSDDANLQVCKGIIEIRYPFQLRPAQHVAATI